MLFAIARMNEIKKKKKRKGKIMPFAMEVDNTAMWQEQVEGFRE